MPVGTPRTSGASPPHSHPQVQPGSLATPQMASVAVEAVCGQRSFLEREQQENIENGSCLGWSPLSFGPSLGVPFSFSSRGGAVVAASRAASLPSLRLGILPLCLPTPDDAKSIKCVSLKSRSAKPVVFSSSLVWTLGPEQKKKSIQQRHKCSEDRGSKEQQQIFLPAKK